MEEASAELGGRLQTPDLSCKYSWLRVLFGWDLAKRARSCAPEFKWHVMRSWDGMLFRLRNRFFPAQP
jgi:hypothetical protein